MVASVPHAYVVLLMHELVPHASVWLLPCAVTEHVQLLPLVPLVPLVPLLAPDDDVPPLEVPPLEEEEEGVLELQAKTNPNPKATQSVQVSVDFKAPSEHQWRVRPAFIGKSTS
jgi:hypothetical protein